MAWWQSGYASDCKSAYAGSIPAQASRSFAENDALAWAGMLCQNIAPSRVDTATATNFIPE
jgi:hypothetical protein